MRATEGQACLLTGRAHERAIALLSFVLCRHGLEPALVPPVGDMTDAQPTTVSDLRVADLTAHENNVKEVLKDYPRMLIQTRVAHKGFPQESHQGA